IAVTVHNGAVPLAIASQTLTDGQTVSGTPDWAVTTSGVTADKVEYWIDGTLRHTDQAAPYDFNWDTTQDRDGQHTLTVRAVAGSQVVKTTITVTVRNTAPSSPSPTPSPTPAPAPTPPAVPVAVASQTIADGARLAGTVAWSAAVTG